MLYLFFFLNILNRIKIYLIFLFKIKITTNDDQRNLNIARKRFNIKIDKNCTIFENRTWKKIKNHNVYFVSYPGCVSKEVSLKMKFNQWKRGIINYIPKIIFG